MKKDWLYNISPCIIAAVLAVIGLIDSSLSMQKSGGWSFLGVIVGVPILLVAILVDVIIKKFIKKTGMLWLVESGVVFLGILLLYTWFHG